MAYAAVVYLRQLLEEEFIQFLCRVLEFEESKVKDFHLRVDNVLNKLNSVQYISPSHLAELQNYFLLLAPTIVDVDLIDEAALFDRVLLYDRTVLDRIPQLMFRLDDINSRLENFVDSRKFRLQIVSSHSSVILAQQSLMVFANNLLSLNKEYQQVVSLLLQVAEEAISLLNSLGILLLKVERSTVYHPAGNQIRHLSGEAGDQIEDCLTGYPFSWKKIDVLALRQVKQIMGYLKEIIDQFDSHTRKDQHQLNELRSKSRSSFMSQLHHHGLLHQRKNFFCIRAECEEDPREVSDYMLSLENVTQVRGSAESSQKLEQIVIGLDDDIARVVDELTGPSPTLSMVTIAGMGGIGKTTLAKKVFHHPSIVYHFHFIAWVNSISSPDQALSHLLQSIASVRNGIPGQISDEDSESSPDGIHDQSREDKGQILWRSLRKRKYLIVVDDLWSFHAWNDIEIYFPDDSLGSRILLTSRFMEFPTFIPRNHLHCMELLNEDKSWEMLQYLVFGANQVYPGELTSIGALIAKKCRGLRLAIVVIAGILLSIPRSCVHWESVLKSINTTESGSVEKCLNILALSYNCLPLHLRACFLFMGSFPANCEIDVQKLINLWIADGLMEARPSKPPEKVAEDCLEDLIRRCLVVVGQRSFDGKIKTCFIHELLRQLCLRESSKESFMQVFPGEAVDQGLEERRHLIFTSINHAADVHLLPPLCHPRSFILHTPGFDISQDVLMFKLSCFKWLRVLDIYFLPLDVFPTGILDLVNLRYLALSISYMLDASISRLWKLQTLVVYGPWIPRVVKYSPTLLFDYWKMRWLRHISVRVPSCFGHIDLPERSRGGYPVSSNLQTLSTVTFSSCTQEAFLLLINLKNLGIYETREDYENGTCLRCFQNLHSLAELETLKCSFFKAREAARSLNPDVLPASLKKLTLIRSYLSWDKMCLLAKLPRLETLKLKDYAFMGEVWEATEVIFGGLKYLLVDKTDLAEWEAEGTDHFPCLKRLVLRSCKSLCEIPFDSFTVLEKIDLHNCSRSAENLAKQFQEQYGFPEVTATSTKRAVEKGGQSYEFEY